MELSAVAPRITPLRDVMRVLVQIPEFATRLIAVRMLRAMARSPGNHVELVEYAIQLANVYHLLHHQK